MKKWLSIAILLICVLFVSDDTSSRVLATMAENIELLEEATEVDAVKAALEQEMAEKETEGTAEVVVVEEMSEETKEEFVIVLDPGHGGKDPGAVRIHDGVTYAERDLVLKIAKYCKEELEKYEGVRVYLTRSNNASELMSRLERTEYALEKGADVIVSLHLNATGETYTTVSGALVYCPNKDTQSGAVSQELAYDVLDELAKTGLTNRGILINEGLGMVIYPKKNKVPGILIEHAFINCPEDVANHLTSGAKLKKLGVADAKGIVNYYNLKKINEPKVNIIKNEEYTQGTEYILRTLTVEDAASLQYAVWTKENDETSIIWKDAVKKGSDIWESSLLVSELKKKGSYLVEAYVVDQDNNKTCVASTTLEIKGPKAKKFAMENVNPEKGTFQVRIQDLSSEADLKKVTAKVWCAEDKSDSHTYTAKLQKDGSYLLTVNLKNHNYHYGTYSVQLIAKDKNGIKSTFKARTLSFERPALNTSVEPDAKFKNYTIKAKHTIDITSLKMAVWSTKNGQDDLKWYKANLDEEDNWSVKVPYSKHKTAGDYYADLYGTTVDGQEICLERTTFKVNAPKIKNIVISKIDMENGTFTVFIKGVQAEAGVDKVILHTWTQDDRSDLHKYTAKKVARVNYRVDIKMDDYLGNNGKYQFKAHVRDKRKIVRAKTKTYKFEMSEE